MLGQFSGWTNAQFLNHVDSHRSKGKDKTYTSYTPASSIPFQNGFGTAAIAKSALGAGSTPSSSAFISIPLTKEILARLTNNFSSVPRQEPARAAAVTPTSTSASLEAFRFGVGRLTYQGSEQCLIDGHSNTRGESLGDNILNSLVPSGSENSLKRRRELYYATADSISHDRMTSDIALAMKSGYSAGYFEDMGRALRDYSIWCEAAKMTGFPVTFASIAGFSTHKLMVLKHAVKTYEGWLSAFRRGCEFKGLQFVLPPRDEMAFSLLKRGLKIAAKRRGTGERKKLVRMTDIEAIYQAMIASGITRDNELLLLEMLLAHDGFLRTREHVDGNLRISDIIWITEVAGEPAHQDNILGMEISLWDTKTGKREQEPQRVLIATREGPLCTVRRTWDHLREHGLLAMTSAEGLFCTLNAAGNRQPAKPMTYPRFVEGVRKWLLAAGRTDVHSYTGHSFRGGGFCDALDGGLPTDMAITQGRWKSNAWMRYRRLTYQMLDHLRRIRSLGGFMGPGRPSEADGPVKCADQRMQSDADLSEWEGAFIALAKMLPETGQEDSWLEATEEERQQLRQLQESG